MGPGDGALDEHQLALCAPRDPEAVPEREAEWVTPRLKYAAERILKLSCAEREMERVAALDLPIDTKVPLNLLERISTGGVGFIARAPINLDRGVTDRKIIGTPGDRCGGAVSLIDREGDLNLLLPAAIIADPEADLLWPCEAVRVRPEADLFSAQISGCLL